MTHTEIKEHDFKLILKNNEENITIYIDMKFTVFKDGLRMEIENHV